MAGARAWAATLEPYSIGTWVNVIADLGDEASPARIMRRTSPAWPTSSGNTTPTTSST